MKMQKNVAENIDYKYGEIETAISIYMGDISKSRGPEEVKKE